METRDYSKQPLTNEEVRERARAEEYERYAGRPVSDYPGYACASFRTCQRFPSACGPCHSGSD